MKSKRIEEGSLYAAHSMRVAYNCHSKEQKIVALLHDTIKNTGITPEYFISQGFPTFIVDAILSVTQKKDESLWYSPFLDNFVFL